MISEETSSSGGSVSAFLLIISLPTPLPRCLSRSCPFPPYRLTLPPRSSLPFSPPSSSSQGLQGSEVSAGAQGSREHEAAAEEEERERIAYPARVSLGREAVPGGGGTMPEPQSLTSLRMPSKSRRRTGRRSRRRRRRQLLFRRRRSR